MIEKIIYRDAPVDIKPLQDKIEVLETEISNLKNRANALETEVEKLKEP